MSAPRAACERIGLGCASLFGLPTSNERMRVLAAAYDAGIRHFDVAPIYGLGVAESELGEFLRNRSDCVVATKFGLRPTVVGRVAGLIQPPVRKLLQRSSAMKDAVKQSGGSPESGFVGRLLYARQPLDLAHLRTSLDKSRRALGRDALDIWLLHDPVDLSSNAGDAIAEFLDRARDRSEIGAWGLAGDVLGSGATVATIAARGDVVQYPYDLPHGQKLPAGFASRPARYSYGFLSDAIGAVRRVLAADPVLARSCCDVLGVDLTSESELVGFLARDAIRANPDGKVLYSTTNAGHLLHVLNEIDRPDRDPARDVQVAKLLRTHGKAPVRDH